LGRRAGDGQLRIPGRRGEGIAAEVGLQRTALSGREQRRRRLAVGTELDRAHPAVAATPEPLVVMAPSVGDNYA